MVHDAFDTTVMSLRSTVMVDAVNHGGIRRPCRPVPKSVLFAPGVQVGLALGLADGRAGAFQHDVDAQIAPGSSAGLRVGEELDVGVVDARNQP